LRDAFGAILSVSDLRSKGLGEAPALNAGLHDPEDPQHKLTIPQFSALYASEVAEWPRWRRVDLEVKGTLIASAGVQKP